MPATSRNHLLHLLLSVLAYQPYQKKRLLQRCSQTGIYWLCGAAPIKAKSSWCRQLNCYKPGKLYLTWPHGFSASHYAATLAARVPGENLCADSISNHHVYKASQRYWWPGWMVYDQTFRQEAAGNRAQSWARVDPGIYAQRFTRQAISAENWCTKCQCPNHATASCPYRSRKKPWNHVGGVSNTLATSVLTVTANSARNVATCTFVALARSLIQSHDAMPHHMY